MSQITLHLTREELNDLIEAVNYEHEDICHRITLGGRNQENEKRLLSLESVGFKLDDALYRAKE